jgi:hypothetical protein
MPLGIAAASAFALAAVLGGERKLEACTDPAVDPDHDFLCTVQERILGTSPNVADSDQDGFDDLEELARGSSPISWNDVPGVREPVHLGLTAHGGDDGSVHVLAAVHSADMNLRDTNLTFGVQSGRQMMTLPITWLASRSTSQITTDASGTGLIQLLDIALDPALVHALGELTFYATASIAGTGTVTSADTVRFLSIDGFVVLSMAPPRPVPSPPGQQVPGPGNIYVPLPTGPGGGGAPSSWSSGEICFQRTSPVAVNGPVVTQEVVSAECMNGWEGYCPPSCTASVGSTYATVDPVGLIGG